MRLQKIFLHAFFAFVFTSFFAATANAQEAAQTIEFIGADQPPAPKLSPGEGLTAGRLALGAKLLLGKGGITRKIAGAVIAGAPSSLGDETMIEKECVDNNGNWLPMSECQYQGGWRPQTVDELMTGQPANGQPMLTPEKNGHIVLNSGSRILGQNLGTKPNDCDAHHIVAQKSPHPSAIAAREELKQCGIDIHDARNGVWLPRGPAPGCTGQKHAKVHTDWYYRRVLQRLLDAKTLGGCEEMEAELEKMKNELSAGGLK